MKKDDFIFSIFQLRDYLEQSGWDMSRINLPTTRDLKQFFTLIPKYYVNHINWYEKDDPLAKMIIPNNVEKDVQEYERVDPIGDRTHSPVPGIVHRYPDRCLLMLTNSCAVHCRFCFRRNLLGTQRADVKQSFEYIAAHKELWEVILSGGDPFMFTDQFLESVLMKLSDIAHVKVVRFHTRTPTVYPTRVNDAFMDVVNKSKKQIIFVLHINHSREITTEFIACVKRLKSHGALVLSQTVLLKGVNDDAHVLKNLFYQLVEIGVKPYYLHHLDVAAGTHHFRISVEEGKKLIGALRGNISGVCMPEYVIDVPGGHGKIPVFWFHHTKEGVYQAVNFEGRQIRYKDPATG